MSDPDNPTPENHDLNQRPPIKTGHARGATDSAEGGHAAPDPGERNTDLTIHVEALAGRGPSEPRPESRAIAVLHRLTSQAMIWCLVAWGVFVVAVVLMKSLSNHGAELEKLVLGGLAAIVGAVAAVLALCAKQSDHQAGREPAKVMSVSWSTRFLLAGVGFMIIGSGIFLSVR